MAVILNKNSFWLHSQLTAFASKTTLARIDFLRQVDDWRTANALIMLKFLSKTIQKNNCVANTHVGKRYEKHVRLLSSARAVARHAAHDSRRQNYGNAEAIRRWQTVSAYGKEIE
jgi:hypothetical protein